MSFKRMIGLGFCTVLFAGIASVAQAADPSPLGAWFGVARPCTPNLNDYAHTQLGYVDPPNTGDAGVCAVACQYNAPSGVCPTSAFPVPEVTMMPALYANGLVTATDFASVMDGHSTSQGNWEYQGKQAVDPGGKGLDRFQASFIWFQSRSNTSPNPIATFAGVIKPRFVTFFDAANPDEMRGFIQPFFYPITDAKGFVNLIPFTPYPTPVVVQPIPLVCDPTAAPNPSQPICFGTFHFVLRRVNSH